MPPFYLMSHFSVILQTTKKRATGYDGNAAGTANLNGIDEIDYTTINCGKTPSGTFNQFASTIMLSCACLKRLLLLLPLTKSP